MAETYKGFTDPNQVAKLDQQLGEMIRNTESAQEVTRTVLQRARISGFTQQQAHNLIDEMWGSSSQPSSAGGYNKPSNTGG